MDRQQIQTEFEHEYKLRCGHPAVWVRQLKDYNNSDTRNAWHFWQAAHALYAPTDYDRKDAARYRFIRGKIGYDHYGLNLPCGNTSAVAQETDAAIDKAIAAKKQEAK